MLRDLYVVAFSTATGFTASGIIANLYRLVFPKAETSIKSAHIGIMVFAGPSMLFGNSLKAMREHKSTRIAFWFAAAVSAYWSLVLGMIVLRILFAL
jgi:EamA domain-containing membrane protein RarD